MTGLLELPIDTLFTVCSYLSLADLHSATQVNLFTHQLLSDDRLWHDRAAEHPGLRRCCIPQVVSSVLTHSVSTNTAMTTTTHPSTHINHLPHVTAGLQQLTISIPEADDIIATTQPSTAPTTTSAYPLQSLAPKQQCKYYHTVIQSVKLVQRHRSSYSMTLNEVAIHNLLNEPEWAGDDANVDPRTAAYGRLLNSCTPIGSPTFKLVVTGERNSGVTTLMDTYRDGCIPEHLADSELRLRHAVAQLRGVDCPVQLQLIDQRPSVYTTPFTAAMLTGPVGILRCIDLTEANSLHRTRHYLRVLRRFLPSHKYSSLPLLLCGTKADFTEERRITAEQIAKFVDEVQLPYVEVDLREMSTVQFAVHHLMLQIQSVRTRQQQAERVSRSRSSQCLMHWLSSPSNGTQVLVTS